MLRFSRSDPAAAPRKARVLDGAGAKAWLAGMTQPASVDSLAEIAEVLKALGAPGVQEATARLQPERKFAIAERIRGVLLPVLNARGDGGFAVLPLEDDFVTHFWAAVDAAVALRDLYAWLVSQLSDVPVLAEATLTGAVTATGGAQPAPGKPTFVSGVGALHRALDVNAQLLLCIQRARWPAPARILERHCVLGQLVRDLDCQDVEIADALRVGITRTCRAAFVMPLMIALSDPSSRNAVEFEMIRMAAQRWSAKVGFRLERRSDAATAPARPIANPGPTLTLGGFVLRFDTQSALQSIDKRLDAMAEGKSPREVGIGDSLRPQAARELLLLLRQRWGAVSPADVDSPDRPWRASPGQQVTAVVGMPTRGSLQKAAGAPRAGQNTYSYQQQDRHGGITRQREEIERERVDELLANAETWTLAAEAADAVRCVRKYGRPRIGLQRLIGLKLGIAAPDSPFLVGWVEALQGVLPDDGSAAVSSAHVVRVRLAPGLPQLIHASIDGVDLDCALLLVPSAGPAGAGRSARPVAFVPMLSQVDAVAFSARDDDGWDGVRASPRDYGLILPHATFRPLRLVKAGRRGAVAVIRLEELMMRGADFDLVRFSLL